MILLESISYKLGKNISLKVGCVNVRHVQIVKITRDVERSRAVGTGGVGDNVAHPT